MCIFLTILNVIPNGSWFSLRVGINFKRSESIRFRYTSFNASMFDKMPKNPVFFLSSMILISLGVLRFLTYSAVSSKVFRILALFSAVNAALESEVKFGLELFMMLKILPIIWQNSDVASLCSNSGSLRTSRQ